MALPQTARPDDEYTTVLNPCEGLFKAKGSKHFGYVFPIQNASEAENHLAQLRKIHNAARHHAFAWRLGTHGETFRTYDDGEPSNTAGSPILGALRSRGVTYCLGVVIRYFGGTKLGVGGLIEAYREATFAALDNGTIVLRHITCPLQISFPYEKMGEVMSFLKKWGLSPLESHFDLLCTLKIEIRLRDAENFKSALKTASIQVKGLDTK